MRGFSWRRADLRAADIRTGLKWKLSAAIALVGALVAVALSLVVHNAARVSMLDNARDLAAERIQIAQRNYELSGRPNFPNVKVDDPKKDVTYMKAAPTLADVATALGTLGLSPRELAGVLQALRAANALEAELVIQ